MLKMLLYYPVFPKVTIASSPDYPCIFKKKKRLVYVDVLFLPADPGRSNSTGVSIDANKPTTC
jgi:hypothetical protein